MSIKGFSDEVIWAALKTIEDPRARAYFLGKDHGAAVAFGLMGMAFAIRGRLLERQGQCHHYRLSDVTLKTCAHCGADVDPRRYVIP